AMFFSEALDALDPIAAYVFLQHDRRRVVEGERRGVGRPRTVRHVAVSRQLMDAIPRKKLPQVPPARDAIRRRPRRRLQVEFGEQWMKLAPVPVHVVVDTDAISTYQLQSVGVEVGGDGPRC